MSWTAAAPAYAAWHISGGSGLSTRRITQAGIRRITEQGIIRIVARMADAGDPWTTATAPSDTWRFSDA
jgi:hypothetical protein